MSRVRPVIALFFAAALAAGCVIDSRQSTSTSPSGPSTPAPAATASAGTVTTSPSGVGIVSATTFAFTAQGFASSDDQALTTPGISAMARPRARNHPA